MRFLLAILLVAGLGVSQAQLTADVSRRADPSAVASGHLFVASRAVPLYSQHECVGELPARTVVEAELRPEPPHLRLRYQGRLYEADAEAFVAEDNLLQDMARREDDVQVRYRTLSTEFQVVRKQITELQEEAHWWEASTRQMAVKFPAPASVRPGVTNLAGQEVVLVTDAPDLNRPAWCRRELRKLTRRAEKLEQQIAGVEIELARMTEIRALVQKRFLDFRVASSPSP